MTEIPANPTTHVTMPESKIRALLLQFSKPNEPERAEALVAVRTAGREGVAAILRILRTQETARDIGYRLCGLSIIAMVAIVVVMGRRSMATSEPEPLMIFPVVGCFVALLVLARFLLPTNLERSARAALTCLHTDLEDPSTLAPLLDTYGQFVDPRMNVWNAIGITRMLNQAPPTTLRRLNDRQRLALRKIVSRAASVHSADDWRHGAPDSVDLLVAAISALGVLRDRDAAISIRRIAEEPAQTDTQKRVVDAAIGCLTAWKTTKAPSSASTRESESGRG